VGDLRLAEIREAVQRKGHTAEFRGGGTLLVDGTVIVRKNQASGGIEIEAANPGLSLPTRRTTDRNGRPETNGSFYAVKKVIYERLAVVAGA
jgi:cleavage and polyadenylation specificity factor subunit 2